MMVVVLAQPRLVSLLLLCTLSKVTRELFIILIVIVIACEEIGGSPVAV